MGATKLTQTPPPQQAPSEAGVRMPSGPEGPFWGAGPWLGGPLRWGLGRDKAAGIANAIAAAEVGEQPKQLDQEEEEEGGDESSRPSPCMQGKG